nr:hypothetical protein [Okeania sp. SIO3I5]
MMEVSGQFRLLLQDLCRTTISSRGEWHSPSTDSVLFKNLRKSCTKYFDHILIGRLKRSHKRETAMADAKAVILVISYHSKDEISRDIPSVLPL